MKKLMIGMMAVLVMVGISGTALASDKPFNATMSLLKAITITKTHDLVFPDTAIITGSPQDIVVAPGDGGAAAFTATGKASRNVTRSVVESTINMVGAVSSDLIAVDTFVLAGPTAFDGSGDITGLKVGATAHVLAASSEDEYSGAATFRLIYN